MSCSRARRAAVNSAELRPVAMGKVSVTVRVGVWSAVVGGHRTAQAGTDLVAGRGDVGGQRALCSGGDVGEQVLDLGAAEEQRVGGGAVQQPAQGEAGEREAGCPATAARSVTAVKSRSSQYRCRYMAASRESPKRPEPGSSPKWCRPVRSPPPSGL